MAPDADAGKSLGQRSDPFAPLTSQLLPVGDSHEIYVETVGRADGIPAVYLHGGPGSGCQPDHRRLFDPERFHAVLFDQRGAGRSRPKGRREDNTLPHLIADMETIREQFGFERWMIVGGSWGATLALAYAQAHPHRVTGMVLRATFLGTRDELEGAFVDVLPRFYPDLSDDFLKIVAPGRAHATARRLLAPHSRFRPGGARPGRPRLERMGVTSRKTSMTRVSTRSL
jgi:proline iminopeptidase